MCSLFRARRLRCQNEVGCISTACTTIRMTIGRQASPIIFLLSLLPPRGRGFACLRPRMNWHRDFAHGGRGGTTVHPWSSILTRHRVLLRCRIVTFMYKTLLMKFRSAFPKICMKSSTATNEFVEAQTLYCPSTTPKISLDIHGELSPSLSDKPRMMSR